MSQAERSIRFTAFATVFVASACIMIVELAAGRLISRFLGQSLYTWTSVIGVVLAGISVGNYMGGLCADRFDPRRALSVLFICSSLACMAVPAFNYGIGQWKVLWELSWPARILAHVTVAFFVPSILMGTISPVVAKMALDLGIKTGQTIGSVYAWGAVGSIVGTFLAGFYLIAAMGTVAVMIAVASVLGAMGLLYGYGAWLPQVWIFICIASCLATWAPGAAAEKTGAMLHFRDPPSQNVLYRDDSQYQHISVTTMRGNPDIRGLYLDKMLHNEIDIRHPTNLLYKYWWVYEAVLNKFSEPGKPVLAFVLGGGGYAFPQYLALTRPGSRVDVAEVDPEVTRVAYAVCGLRETPSIRIHHMDARNFISDLLRRKRSGEKVPSYQYILGDTFNDYSVPYHLTTEEFHRQLSELMTDDGMYLLNMIDRFDSGRFLSAMVATCRRVFPDVQVFFCHLNLSKRGTYVVVCSKKPRDFSDIVGRIKAQHADFLGSLLSREQLDDLRRRMGEVALTDDYAPVENLLAEVVREDSPEGMDVYYLRLGLEAADRKLMVEAVRKFEQALEVNPGNMQALFNLGVAWMREGNAEKALWCFVSALQIDPSYIEVRNNTAVVLAQLGRIDEAVEQLNEVLKQKPDNLDAHINLAALLAQKGRMDEAAQHLSEALRIQPNNPIAKDNLQRLKAMTR
jgi:tetratricopeptide (TPR) repeat protein/MFS family permease